MKINKIILVSLVLIMFLSVCSVSAVDENLADGAVAIDENGFEDISVDSEPVLEDNSDDDLSSTDGETSEDINVEVTNVFKGYNNTIKVTAPNAVGNVNITVGDKTYTPQFVDGVATQEISEYGDGVNNVTVFYNNLVKNASFKVLDGVVTYQTFYDYFNPDNDFYFYDYIPDGVTLDFQGNITYINLNKTEGYNLLSININKPVNIISTTGDAFIDFNGQAGSLLGEYQGSVFSVRNGGSWSNITGITIHNTQVWIFNTHHVTLDRIRVLVEDARIGSGVGATSVRANSTWCTVKNSYFYTRNNGGSSSLVMAWADYCTFDNNTVVGEGHVGNLIYATTYNVDFPDDVTPNCHNNFTNNIMYGPSSSSSICWMLVISGKDCIIKNNTMYYTGDGIQTQWIDTSWHGGDAVPEGNKFIGNKLYGGCSMSMSKYSIAYDNIAYGDVTVSTNSTFYNNTVYGTLKCSSNCTVYNNSIYSVEISNSRCYDSFIYNNTIKFITDNGLRTIFENNTITDKIQLAGEDTQLINSNCKDITISTAASKVKILNNTITGLVTVQSNGNTITGNNITNSKTYAVDLKKTTGNVVTDNYLLSSKHFADEAVSTVSGNVIKDNYPLPPAMNIDIELLNNFENLVTVTVPNATGSITFSVSDKKYTVNLTEGVATQRISGLDPGNYTLTVKYQDDKTPIYGEDLTTLSVPKIDVYDFSISANEFMEGLVVIPVSLPSDAVDGKVVINGIYEADVINGACSVTVLGLVEGEHDITVQYVDGQRYADKTISAHIKVNHNSESFLILPDVSTYYTSGKIIAKLVDINSLPIANATVVINGNDVKTDENGEATIDYNFALGTYKVSASFNGNDDYNASSAEATLKVLPRFAENKNIVMNYYDGSKYSVRVLDDSGKFSAGQLVTFNINGKTSTVKTDKNGYATLSITNLPGKYTVTASYKGQTVKNTVQVKQNLKASKVTVKKSAKKLVLKATLSKIKGKKLTFKFNGKTYTAKTDKNGVAKVTIKKNVIKKLKKGKKYTFTVKYVSNTVKNKVIVK